MNSPLSKYTLAPLTAKVTSRDVQAYKKLNPNHAEAVASERTSIILLTSVAALTWATAILVWALHGMEVALPTIVIASIWTIFALACLPPLRKRYVSSIHLLKFAEANGLRYEAFKNGPDYTGVIFKLGRNPKAEDVITSPSDSFEMGRHTYVVGAGKFARRAKWDYVRIPLSQELPHMVLRANTGVSTRLPLSLDKNQAVPLENVASKSFTLYAPTDAQQAARTIFTPEFTALLNGDPTLNVEIINNQLFLYGKQNRPDSEQYMKRVLLAIEHINSTL